MRILVANLGSTSFKYKLFSMPEERVLAVGGADRIGATGGTAAAAGIWSIEANGRSEKGEASFPDHGAAIDLHLQRLIDLGALASLDELDAIGFKAVHGGPISGAVLVDDEVIATMNAFADVAPAHNPIYVAAMKAFAEKLPSVPQVAAFETAFHQTIPLARQIYGIPHEWTEQLGIRRYGFHGASHRYIATRMREIAPEAKRIISFHLGGSSSVCAIQDGRSVATSMGMTPQSGLFQNNRVGDFDTFAIRKLTAQGLDLSTILTKLSKEGGWLGASGVSADLRDIEREANAGNERCRLAIGGFVEGCRHYLGAYLVALGGVDAVVFTGGIGQHSSLIREMVCRGLSFAGIRIDENQNTAATGKDEARIDTRDLHAQVWVMPTNEELIVARQTLEVLKKQPQSA